MILSPSNIKKTKEYFKRNGLKNTIYAAVERVIEKKGSNYTYIEPDERELERQRKNKLDEQPLISIVVPTYETKPVYLEDLILSCEEQTYTHFEIVIVDASKTDFVEHIVHDYQGQFNNIVYKRLEENKGISDNTNEGIDIAKGNYIGLLDHDDVLTKDALYTMVKCINEKTKKYGAPYLVYSDEDKTDTYLEKYYEPHFKGKTDAELIMSNNYVCHFSLYRHDIIKTLKLRSEFDGAQDYDLVLRTFGMAYEYEGGYKEKIHHVPKVLYHWRCHEASTAENPTAKAYAYENGRRALEEYAGKRFKNVIVSSLKHVGFYRVDYANGVLKDRHDVAAVGGPVYEKGKILSGLINLQGKPVYEGLNQYFSGYMHGAVLTRDADALDIRNIAIRPEYAKLFKEQTGFSYPLSEKDAKSVSNEEIIKKSLKFCNKLKSKGITLLYDPQFDAKKHGENNDAEK